MVLFLHVTSKTQDDPSPELLEETMGRQSWPSLAFLDAEGRTLGRQTDRNVAAFEATLKRLADCKGLEASAKSGDREAARRLFVTEFLELDRLSFSSARERLDGLGGFSTDEQARIDAKLIELEVGHIVRSRRGEGREAVAAAMTKMLEAGRIPTGRATYTYWSNILYGADKAADLELHARGLAGFEKAFGDDAGMKVVVESYRRRHEVMKSAAPPKREWTWADVELFGHRSASRASVLEALPLKIGAPYQFDRATWKEHSRILKERFDFHQVKISAVRYVGYKAYLVVDVVEKGDEDRVLLREPPTGTVALADEKTLEIQDRLNARSRVLFEQSKPSREMAEHGFLDYDDAAMHAIVLELRETVPAHRENLIAVLLGDSDASKRGRAATLLNWAGQIEDSIRSGLPALSDPSGLVRNNITRFMLHYLARTESVELREAVIDELCRQLGRPSHGDRNKASYGLLNLLEAHPEHAARVEKRAGELIRRIAETSILSNVRDPAKSLSKKLAAASKTDTDSNQ